MFLFLFLSPVSTHFRHLRELFKKASGARERTGLEPCVFILPPLQQASRIVRACACSPVPPPREEVNCGLSMSGPRVESLFSEGLFTFITVSVDLSYSLAGDFECLPPALQELERVFDVDTDVLLREKYRTFRRSVSQGISKAREFTVLLKGILSLNQDQERWGRIDKELQAVASYSGGFDKHSVCPHFYDFEEDLKLRVDRLKDAHTRLSYACQEIESEKQSLFTALMHTSAPKSSVMLACVWFAKNTLFGLVTFGTAVLFLGLTNFSLCCRKVLNLIKVPFWVMFLICLAVGYKALSRKYQSLESELLRGKSSVSVAINNIRSHVGISLAQVVWKSVSASQIKLTAGRFFSQWQQRDLEQLETQRSELQQLMNCISV